MAAFPWGSIISAGGSLLGGLFDNSFDAKQAKIAREREDNFIQRRTADAKEAGIHPLAAIGANHTGGYAAPTSSVGDAVGDAANALGAGVDAAKNPLADAQLSVLRSEADRNAAEAELARATSRTTIASMRRGGQTLSTDVVEAPRTLKLGDRSVVMKGSSAQDIEDEIGEIGELSGIGRAIGALPQLLRIFDEKGNIQIWPGVLGR